MKKPLVIVFNDIHIKNGNENEVYEAVKYMVDHINKLGVKEIICNGDIFDSRSFQRQSHTDCWGMCLDLFEANGIVCHTNVGNHDKSVYKVENNFLTPFKHHPGIKLYSKITNTKIGDKTFTFSPYFLDEQVQEQLENQEPTDILIGHWSCHGSVNLKMITKKEGIGKKLLSKWKKTYLGHFHQHQEVSEDIIHLPSLLQDSFGEDNIKGFSVIYDDLSYSLVKGKFKELKKIIVDLNEVSISDLINLIEDEKSNDATIRFELIGDDSKLKAVDKSIFKDTGIDVKIKFNKEYDFDTTTKEIPKAVNKYTAEQIKDELKIFCKKKGLNHSEGEKLLIKHLNKT